MSELLQVSIAGRPVGAARPRVTRTGHAFMPDVSVRWEESARQLMVSAWGQAPCPDLVAVEITAWHHRPGRLCRKKDPREAMPARSKPDIDNVAKLCMDALTKAGVLEDDTQVAELVARRFYVAIDSAGHHTEPERVLVTVRRLA